MSSTSPEETAAGTEPDARPPDHKARPASRAAVPEIGGRRHGLDPTRYGDWEKNGRCIDF